MQITNEQVGAIKKHFDIDIKPESTIICDDIVMKRAIDKISNGFNVDEEESTQILLLGQDNKKLYELEFTNGTTTVINDIINKALINIKTEIETTPEFIDILRNSVYNPWSKVPEQYSDTIKNVFDVIKYDAKIPSVKNLSLGNPDDQTYEYHSNFQITPYEYVVNNADMDKTLTQFPQITFHRDVVKSFTGTKSLRYMTDKLYFENRKCSYVLTSDLIAKHNLSVTKYMSIKHGMDDDFTKYIKNICIYGVQSNFGEYDLTEEEKNQLKFIQLINLSGNAIFVINNLKGDVPIKGYTTFYDYRDIRLEASIVNGGNYSVHFDITVTDDCPIDFIKLYIDAIGIKDKDELERFKKVDLHYVQLDIEERIIDGNHIGNINGVVEKIVTIFVPDGSNCPQFMLNNGEFTDDLWNMKIYNESDEDSDVDEDEPDEDSDVDEDVEMLPPVYIGDLNGFNPNVIKFNPFLSEIEQNEAKETVYINKELCHDMILFVPNVPVYVKEFGAYNKYRLQPTGYKKMSDKTRYEIVTKVHGKTHILIFRRVLLHSFGKNNNPKIYFNLCIKEHQRIYDKLKAPINQPNHLPRVPYRNYYSDEHKFIPPPKIVFSVLEPPEICPLSLNEIEKGELYYKCTSCTAVMSQHMFDNWCKTTEGQYHRAYCPQCETYDMPTILYRNSLWTLSAQIKNTAHMVTRTADKVIYRIYKNSPMLITQKNINIVLLWSVTFLLARSIR